MKLSGIITTAAVVAVLLIHTTAFGIKFPDISDLIDKQIEDAIKAIAERRLAITQALEKRDDRIVYIEADSPMRGNWLEVFRVGDHNVMKLDVYANDQLFDNPNLKWRLHHVGGDKFALESVGNRNHYISGDTFKVLVSLSILRESGYPYDDDDVQLSVTGIDTGRGDQNEWMKFTTKKGVLGYSSWTSSETFFATINFNEPYWRLYLPEVSDEYTSVDSIDNRQNSHPIEWSYTITVGMSMTNGQTITESLESSLSTEISGAFGSASASLTYTQTWEQQSSQTFSREESRTLSATVPARSRLEVRQLTGHYGGTFDIRANSFQFINPDSGAANTMSAFASPIASKK